MGAKDRTGGLDFRTPRTRLRKPPAGVLMTLLWGMQALILISVPVLILMAVHVQLGGVFRLAATGAVLAAGALAAGLWLAGQGRPAWIVTGLMLVAAGLWWMTIRPSNDRIWAADVEHGVTSVAGPGDMVTLNNVRNFRWQDRDRFTPAWEARTYDLSQLTRMDVFTSAWSGPAVAHTLVSFGFADGGHVVFSAEIRREKGEAFSIMGGFFRQFELVLIAADERDIIHLRTAVRGEAVSMFPLSVPKPVMQEAFRSFAAYGNDLAERPRFYNTLVTNCTTIPWRLARELSPGLPIDWRIVLSGHFPAYMQDLGITGQGQTREAMLAWARLRGPGPDEDDSAAWSATLRGKGD